MGVLNHLAHSLPYPWLQHLAGILPLSAFIEFIDLPMKLHLYQLSDSIPLWNWPVTPAGARTLLGRQENEESCYLDHPTQSSVLNCIDGHHGYCYPSSAPTTVRLCVAAHPVVADIPNKSVKITTPKVRRQNLEIVVLRRQPNSRRRFTTTKNEPATWINLPRLSRCNIISVLGWMMLVGGLIVCGIFQIYFALAYLLLMPLTGVLVSKVHGGLPRKLVDDRSSAHTRIVIATDSLNASKLTVFYGESSLVNALLKRPFKSDTNTPSSEVPYFLLRFLILSQWAFAIGSCALQDWNGIVVTIWIVFCAITNSYLYPPRKNARDWLRHSCLLSLDRISATFTSRRAMLSAIVALNPDTAERRTSWMDPILSPSSSDRQEWEAALLAALNSGECDPNITTVPKGEGFSPTRIVLEKACEEINKEQYWWKFIDEGVEMSRNIQIAIEDCLKQSV